MTVETGAEALKLYVSAVREEADVRSANGAAHAEIIKIDRPVPLPEDVMPDIQGRNEEKKAAVAYAISELFHSLLNAPETLRLAERRRLKRRTDSSLVIARTVEIDGFGPLDLSHAITLVKSDETTERRHVYKLMVGGIPDLGSGTSWTNDPVIETFSTPVSRQESVPLLGRTLDTLSSLVEVAGL